MKSDDDLHQDERNFNSQSKDNLLDDEHRINLNFNKNVPKAITIGLNMVMDIIEESYEQSPKICLRSLESLNNYLQGLKPESLKNEPPCLIKRYFDLIESMIKLSYVSIGQYTNSFPSYDNHYSLILELSLLSLLTLSIARGDIDKILNCIKILLIDCNARNRRSDKCRLQQSGSHQRSILNSFEIAIPDILVHLNRHILSYLLGKHCLPEFCSSKFTTKSLCESFQINYLCGKNNNQFSSGSKSKTSQCSTSLAFDGQHLILLQCNRISMIGSGYNNTCKGQEIFSSTLDSSETGHFRSVKNFNKCCNGGWIGFINEFLFVKFDCDWSTNQIFQLDPKNFEIKSLVPLINDNCTKNPGNHLICPTLSITDGESLILVTLIHNDCLVIREFKPIKLNSIDICHEKISFSMVSEYSTRLSSIDYLSFGGSINNLAIPSLSTEENRSNNDNLNLIDSFGCCDPKCIQTILSGKEFALILTDKGVVYYTGNSYSLGIRHHNSVNKWSLLNLPKPVKIIQISVGHEGNHALLLADDGTVFFVGTAKRGEDGETPNRNRFSKPFRVKKFAEIDFANSKPSIIACNHGTSAIATKSNKLFVFGKDASYSNYNVIRGIPSDFHIKSVVLGKAHMLLLSTKGLVLSSGFSNKGQCGFMISAQPSAHSMSKDSSKRKFHNLSQSSLTDHSSVYEKSRYCYRCARFFDTDTKNSKQLNNCDPEPDIDCSHIVSLHNDFERPRDIECNISDLYLKMHPNSSSQDNENIDGDNHSGKMISIPPTILPISQSKPITQIAAGLHHSILLTKKGEVFSFGSNNFGQLGLGDLRNRFVPTKIKTDLVCSGIIIQIAAGSNHTLLLSSLGEVMSFGDNKNGQLDLDNGGSKHIIYTPSPIKPNIAVPFRSHCLMRKKPDQVAIELLSLLTSLTYSQLFGLTIDDKSEHANIVGKHFSPEEYRSVCRFKDYGGGWGYPPYSVEAIRFSADCDIILGGIGLYGGRGEYNVQIRLFDIGSDNGDIEKEDERDSDSSWRTIASASGVYTQDDQSIQNKLNDTCEIRFEKPILIHPNIKYAIVFHNYSQYSFSGDMGLAQVKGEDETVFNFMDYDTVDHGTETDQDSCSSDSHQSVAEIKYLTIEFDPKSSTAQPEDYLEIYIPQKNLDYFYKFNTTSNHCDRSDEIDKLLIDSIQNLKQINRKFFGKNFSNLFEVVDENQTENWKNSYAEGQEYSNCIFVPGNEIVLMLKTSSNYIQAIDAINNVDSHYGFKAEIIGHEFSVPDLLPNHLNYSSDEIISYIKKMLQIFECDLILIIGRCLDSLLNAKPNDILIDILTRKKNRHQETPKRTKNFMKYVQNDPENLVVKKIFDDNFNILHHSFDFLQPQKINSVEDFFHCHRNMHQFLKDFIELTKDSSGERLARWLQNETLLMPDFCLVEIIPEHKLNQCSRCLSIMFDSSDSSKKLCTQCYFQFFVQTIIDCQHQTIDGQIYKKIYFKIICQNQLGSIVYDPKLSIKLRIQFVSFFNRETEKILDENQSNESIESKLLCTIVKNPYQISIKDKTRFHCITMMKTFENYSLEELRMEMQDHLEKKPSTEIVSMRMFEKGLYLGRWTPASLGRYRIEMMLDGEQNPNEYFINVNDEKIDENPFDMLTIDHDSMIVNQSPIHQKTIPRNLLQQQQRFVKHSIRKYFCSDSAGLRIRALPSLQSEQIGVVFCNGLLTVIDQIENHDGTWVKLSNESIQAYCFDSVDNRFQSSKPHRDLSLSNDFFSLKSMLNEKIHNQNRLHTNYNLRTEAWALQYNKHYNRTLLVSIDPDDRIENVRNHSSSIVQNFEPLQQNQFHMEFFKSLIVPGWFKVDDCNLNDFYPIRNRPSLDDLSTIIGSVPANLLVYAVEMKMNNDGVWIRLSHESLLSNIDKSFQSIATHDCLLDGWILVRSSNNQILLRNAEEISQNSSMQGKHHYQNIDFDTKDGGRDCKKAISNRAAKCIRSVFAAIVWHEGILQDVCKAASFLRFNPEITKESIRIKEHPALRSLLDPINVLFKEVKQKALMRLEYEGLNRCEAITSTSSRYFEDPISFALERYSYYLCFNCNKAYFGGEARCDAEFDAVALKEHPQCPVGPHSIPLDGTDCPLNVQHPPTGQEYALGCGICRNAHTF
ncbi:E3 ubiquitin-protein ligase-like protein [Sarcoptes scabiei]|uniref:E3 ubiquitin-protein ligase-like protein n=1 Tax=Sarcoptes scabiei TaxID=52283 RepID=A0A132AJA0_SARSC|nr:E3 ubiquitin-protein ligase-like protein [Sarcoptes scabiei]